MRAGALIVKPLIGLSLYATLPGSRKEPHEHF